MLISSPDRVIRYPYRRPVDFTFSLHAHAAFLPWWQHRHPLVSKLSHFLTVLQPVKISQQKYSICNFVWCSWCWTFDFV